MPSNPVFAEGLIKMESSLHFFLFKKLTYVAQLNTNNRRKLNVGRATKSLNTIEIKKRTKVKILQKYNGKEPAQRR